jgi:hypothetical protein
MRFMLMHKLDEGVPRNFNPTPEFMARMGTFMEEVASTGVLLAGEGLRPSSVDSRRITVNGGKKTVTDGPFAESKELIAGFAIVDVPTLDDAMEIAERFAACFEGEVDDIEIDVRRVAEFSDFQ